MTTPVPNLRAMRPNYTGPRWIGPLARCLLVGAVLKVLVDVFTDSETEFIGPDGEVYGRSAKLSARHWP